MAYFNYHAKAKNLINNNCCFAAAIFENYHNIKPALVLYFFNNQPIPIREYMWEDYFKLLNNQNITIQDNRTK